MMNPLENENSNNVPMELVKEIKEFKCTTCKDSLFTDKSEYREHYKSDWHIENVRRKTKDLSILDYDDMLLLKNTSTIKISQHSSYLKEFGNITST